MLRLVSRQPSSRPGVALVCVLACLAITVALVSATVRTALQQRRQVRYERQYHQVMFLVEAGVERAVAHLRSEPDYSGETWQLPPEVLPGFASAEVAIEILPAADDPPTSMVRIVARVSADQVHRVQQTYEFPIPERSNSSEETE